MEEQEANTNIDVSTSKQRATLTDSPYEGMCVSLYTYRYGAISFLELVATFEESLGLISPQTRLPPTPERSE